MHISAHGIFSRIDHILGHKTSLKTFNWIEIISSIFFDYKSMKRNQPQKKRNERKKNNYTEIKQCGTKKTNGSMMRSKRKFKNTLRRMTMKT